MPQRLGIYGAGQLGAYLCQAARSLGIETTVVALHKQDMATAYADYVICAPFTDVQATQALLARSDVVTYEVENIPTPILRELGRHSAAGRVRVAPSTTDLVLLQNKLSQKRWLSHHGFATAPFIDCRASDDVGTIAMQVGLPFVQKTHRGGYDGRGVQVIRDLTDDTRLFSGPSIAEQFVADKREIAVLVARTRSGEICVYPAVEMVFDPAGNILRHVCSPAALHPDVAAKAANLATDIVVALNGVGLFAVEMFVVNNEVLVNEIAPRVHNSGHLTLEAYATSQYEQHLRAIMNMSLGPTTPIKPACMMNILNEPALAGFAPLREPGVIRVNTNTYLHWYGKQADKPLRKMGHLTCLAETAHSAQRQCEAAMADLLSNAGLVA